MPTDGPRWVRLTIAEILVPIHVAIRLYGIERNAKAGMVVWSAHDPAEATPTTADDVAGVGVPACVARRVSCPVAKIAVPSQVSVQLNTKQYRRSSEEDLESCPAVSDHIA